MNNNLVTEAMKAYGAALGVADPIRTQFWDDRGLTMTQLRLVCMLYPHQKRPVSDLADEMRVRPPTITGIADRLIKHGFVERLHDEDDRRVVRIELTDEGRRVLANLEAAGRAYLTRVFGRMGEAKVRQFIETMEEFAKAADAVEHESAAAAV